MIQWKPSGNTVPRMKIPYALPFIGNEEIMEVVSSIRSNWLSRGPKTQEFEQSFAEYVESPYAVGLNSCTAGLHLAHMVLGIGAGDEVITSPYTFIATANTIVHCGAKPVFVDIDPVTMNLDHNLLEQAITPRTKAIIPVHFAGFPCEMDQIQAIARKYNLKIIEDAAHAVHTKYKNRCVGSIGDITCFSFYATKNLSTGEGGMITTADEGIADKLRMMSLHGLSKNAWNRYTEKGSWYYEVEYPGFKYNMTDIQASFGVVQLQKMGMMQALREKAASMYTEAFAKLDGLILPYDAPEHRHAWHLYVVRIDEKQLRVNRNELIELLKEAGIGTSVHFIPVTNHPYYLRQGYNPLDYPHAVKAYQAAISLPLYPGMTVEQIEYVIETFTSLLSQYRR